MSEAVSVIIPTRNRARDLETTVASLLKQTILPKELVIVDQSEDVESRERVEALLKTARDSTPARSVTLTYVRDTNISGGAVARNRAMELAAGAIWLFLDDDVVLEPDFIEKLLATYRLSPEAIGVSGVVTNYTPPALIFRVWSRLFCAGPFWDERQPIYWRATRGERGPAERVRKFGAGLMSFRADAIRYHRFDSSLKGVSDGEDVDFCSRLDPQSVLLISPQARLAHYHSPVGRSREHWLPRHARTAGYLYRRNWDHGLRNRLAFALLNCGYILVALLSSAKRGSLAPLAEYWKAIGDSRMLALKAKEVAVRSA